MSNLQKHETWQVTDASKLQEYMTCPRKFFYNYVLGWRPDISNIHLEFGTAWHLAMEHLLLNGYGEESVWKAWELFCEHYDKHFSPNDDLNNAPKNKENALRVLAQYAKQYRSDNFEVMATEVAGSVSIDHNRHLHFKIDSVCRDSRGVFLMDHKTASRFGKMWEASWTLKMQVSLYLHVLHMLYPKEEIYGFVVNAVTFVGPPKVKKNGEPYANSRDTEFFRLPIYKTPAHMREWLAHTHLLIDDLDNDWERLEESTEDMEILEAFPKNTESCTKYGVCPYFDLCSNASFANPLQKASKPPIGFKKEYWDPRDKEETAKKVVHL